MSETRRWFHKRQIGALLMLIAICVASAPGKHTWDRAFVCAGAIVLYSWWLEARLMTRPERREVGDV